MKLKVVANGENPAATKVVDCETGEMLEDVLGVEISLDAMGVEAVLIMRGIDVDIDNLEVMEVVSDTEGDGRDGGDSDN